MRTYTDPQTGLPRYCAYHRLFDESKPYQLWGEATPIYMFLPFIAERIYKYNPAIKLIFLLRDPVERAFSQYRMELARGWEWQPFPLAVAFGIIRVKLFSRDLDDMRDPIRTHSYVSRGFYSRQISRFLGLFPKQSCLFVKSEELLKKHDSSLRTILNFLGVTDQVNIQASRVFVGPEGTPSPMINRVLRLLYRYDRKRLERITALDLSDWS